jgi:hypothetical protein
MFNKFDSIFASSAISNSLLRSNHDKYSIASFCLPKAEIFKKIEPYLTFLNIHQLERQGADIQTKVEELEELNQSLRNRDKMKDDAIAQLSDQVMALTARMQEFELKQQS